MILRWDDSKKDLGYGWVKGLEPFIGSEREITSLWYTNWGLDAQPFYGLSGMSYVWPENQMALVTSGLDIKYIELKTVVEYGCLCSRCGDFNEYAVKAADFKCYSCRRTY